MLTKPYEVLWEFSDYGEISVPRRFFYEVVNIYRPYKFYVIRMFLKLLTTIAVITILILLIIDFQVLDQFNSAGQLLLTLFTVSLPLLLGGVRSAWHRDLSVRRRHLNIRAWAERITRIVTQDKQMVDCAVDTKEAVAYKKQTTIPMASDIKLIMSGNIVQRTLPRTSQLSYWSPTS